MDGLSIGSRVELLQAPRTTSDLPPAVVVGSGVTLLGVVRILGRQRLPLLASVHPHDPAGDSRWLPSGAHLPGIDSTVPLAEYLTRLPLEQGFLIPCSDDLALQAAELPCDLKVRFRTYQPDVRVLRLLVDKGAFLHALEAAGVPHPRTHLIDTVDDLGALSDADLQTSFIKPRSSQRFQRERGVKGFRPGTRAGFRALLEQLLGEGHGLMVQQYVPGPASNHYFVDGFATEGGEIATLFARRRLRMFPTDFGNSSFMVSVLLDDVRPALDSLGHLLRYLDYRGIFSAEFKRDALDGEFRILEINARPWWYVEFAARAGVDVVTLAYRAAYGLPLDPPTHYHVGRTMIYPYYDGQACRAVTGGRWAGLRRFLADVVGADQPVFAWDDPMPALRYWGRATPGIARRCLARRFSRRRPAGTR